MRGWLIHRWIDMHEIFYALSWLVLLRIAGSEADLNRAFQERFGRMHGVAWAFDSQQEDTNA